VSYCAYNSTNRRLTTNGLYCVSSGEGYCNVDIVVLSAGRLVRHLTTVADGEACPSYPLKYDSVAKRLVKSTEAYVCYGYAV